MVPKSSTNFKELTYRLTKIMDVKIFYKLQSVGCYH